MAMIMPQHCSPILSGEGKGVGCNEHEKVTQTEPTQLLTQTSLTFSPHFLLHLSPKGHPRFSSLTGQPHFLLDLSLTGSHVSITADEWWVGPNDRK